MHSGRQQRQQQQQQQQQQQHALVSSNVCNFNNCLHRRLNFLGGVPEYGLQ